jgi:hypothetical protein
MPQSESSNWLSIRLDESLEDLARGKSIVVGAAHEVAAPLAKQLALPLGQPQAAYRAVEHRFTIAGVNIGFGKGIGSLIHTDHCIQQENLPFDALCDWMLALPVPQRRSGNLCAPVSAKIQLPDGRLDGTQIQRLPQRRFGAGKNLRQSMGTAAEAFARGQTWNGVYDDLYEPLASSPIAAAACRCISPRHR